MFVDNFQTAKEALTAATSQAAEKAASSVRDFARKSFRVSMDVRLKAPLVIIPQSSTSHNAVLVDLGLITVGNSFSLLLTEGFSLPAVVEKMDVKLTQLKLSRYRHALGSSLKTIRQQCLYRTSSGRPQSLLHSSHLLLVFSEPR